MNDRGQTIAIGMLFMLTFVVLGISGAQAEIVPQQNEQTELSHYDSVMGDMLRVHSAVGTDSRVSVDMGVRYQPRAILMNPPPVYGSLRTSEGEHVVIDASGAPGEADDFWSQEQKIDTTKIRYSGGYNRLELSDIVVEGWAVYKDHDTPTVQSDIDIISGNTVNLATVRGDQSSTSIDNTQISMAGRDVRDVTVNGPVEIEIPTDLPKSYWKTQLNEAGVTSWSMTSDGVEMTLESGTWTLSLPQSSIDQQDTEASYLVSTDDGVMVLDQWGDPVSGVSVTNDGGTFTSGPDGEVTQGSGTASIDGLSGDESEAVMGTGGSGGDGNKGGGNDDGDDPDNPGKGN